MSSIRSTASGAGSLASASGVDPRAPAGAPWFDDWAWLGRARLAARLFEGLASLHQAGPRAVMDRAKTLQQLCATACELHGLRIEVKGSFPTRPAVLVSNHLGYIDPVVLCALTPVSPIAKREVAAWAGVGLPLERLNVNFVQRGNAWSGARVLRRSLRTLKAGVSVLNFPEGTTTRGKLLPFHLGAFWLARRSGLPIVPIGMDFADSSMCWVDDAGFLPHYARFLWSREHHVRVCIGVPIDPLAMRSEIELSCAARDAICQTRQPFGVPGATEA